MKSDLHRSTQRRSKPPGVGAARPQETTQAAWAPGRKESTKFLRQTVPSVECGVLVLDKLRSSQRAAVQEEEAERRETGSRAWKGDSCGQSGCPPGWPQAHSALGTLEGLCDPEARERGLPDARSLCEMVSHSCLLMSVWIFVVNSHHQDQRHFLQKPQLGWAPRRSYTWVFSHWQHRRKEGNSYGGRGLSGQVGEGPRPAARPEGLTFLREALFSSARTRHSHTQTQSGLLNFLNVDPVFHSV